MSEQYPGQETSARAAAEQALMRRDAAKIAHDVAHTEALMADTDLLEQVVKAGLRLNLTALPDAEWKESMSEWMISPDLYDPMRAPMQLNDVTITQFWEGRDTTYARIQTSGDRPTLYRVPMSSVAEITLVGEDAVASSEAV